MQQDALKMSRCLSVLFLLGLVAETYADVSVAIYKHENGQQIPVDSSLEATAGANLVLTCELHGLENLPDYSVELFWDRRSKDVKSKPENDVPKCSNMTVHHSKYVESSTGPSKKFFKAFKPVKPSDRGLYYCGSCEFSAFKSIHIKVLVKPSDLQCPPGKFQCSVTSHCISSHYKCDGRSDCLDGSDESSSLCEGDPCRGKIQCFDGRCIPTSWCCNKYAEKNCTVAARPACCPPLVDPYDPLHYYNSNQHNSSGPPRTNGRYLFISICVISALLSFVLFLFMVSKLCGFDGMSRSHPHNTARCEHSECAIRREFEPGLGCLYRSENNNEVSDPLISIISVEMSDQPPPYSEVMADKLALDDLIPPPPYSSTNVAHETEFGNNVDASNSNSSST